MPSSETERKIQWYTHTHTHIWWQERCIQVFMCKPILALDKWFRAEAEMHMCFLLHLSSSCPKVFTILFAHYFCNITGSFWNSHHTLFLQNSGTVGPLWLLGFCGSSYKSSQCMSNTGSLAAHVIVIPQDIILWCKHILTSRSLNISNV